MKLQEVTLYENRSHRLLKEGWQDLTEAQQKYQLRWERELFPLLEQYVKLAEAELTADQISAIFKSAEANAMASGTNRNALGKAGDGVVAGVKMTADLAKKVDAKINELGKAAKEAGPVKDADKKFNDLKADIMANNPDSKIVQGIVKVSDWAKANPGKASIAVGILTAIAAFAGGPAGGAAAGLILRSTNELLKGEDLSSAIGKSIKTAAYGAIAGWALQGIGDWLEGLRFDAVPFDKAPGLTTLEVGFTKTFEVPGFSDVKELGSMVIPETDVTEFTRLLDAMKDATAATGSTTDPGAIDAFNELWTFAKTFDKAEFIADMNLSNDIAQAVATANDAFLQNLTAANSAIAAVAQGSIQGAGEKGAFKLNGDEIQPGDVTTSAAGNKKIAGVDSKATSVDPSDLKGRAGIMRAGNESVDMQSEFDRYIAEAGFADMIKGAGAKVKQGAKAAGGAIAKGAKAAGKELGNKVTYNKMMSAWKKAGEPTDTGSIINILSGNGMSPEQISAIGQEQGVELVAKNIGDPETPSAKPADTTATNTPADDSDNAQGADADDSAPADDSANAQGDGPAADNAPAVKPMSKGDTVKGKDGNTYRWEGALYTNVDTGRPIKVQDAINMGLPHPKIDPIVSAIKKAGPAISKLVIDQINSKGVKAGTKDAQVAKTAGAKGTEELPAAQNDAPKAPKAGIAPPGTVASKPSGKVKYKTGSPSAPAKSPMVKT
jgi:hypothetical protein